jgi:hypothetical protein
MSSSHHKPQGLADRRRRRTVQNLAAMLSDELRRELQDDLHVLLEQALEIADGLGLTMVGIDVSVALARLDQLSEAAQHVEPGSDAGGDAAKSA